jgi:hypothetical protein
LTIDENQRKPIKKGEKMRIISQCGSADIPYENVVVFVNSDKPTDIYASLVGDYCYDLPLGVYNSEEDAKFALRYFSAMYLAGVKVSVAPSATAMENLRQAYLGDKKQGETVHDFIQRNILGVQAINKLYPGCTGYKNTL